MINKETVLQRSEEVLHSALDNEAIMMDIQTGEYHNLNSVANTIWKLLETPMSFEGICNALLEEYEISADVCEAETRRFIAQMREKKLILIK